MDTRERYVSAPTIYVTILWVQPPRGRNVLWVQRNTLWVQYVYLVENSEEYIVDNLLWVKDVYIVDNI